MGGGWGAATSVEVMAGRGFTDSSPPIVALPPHTFRVRRPPKVPAAGSPATMDDVKRVLAGLFLLGLSAAGVYGYALSERERIYRQLIADGDAALARDNTGAAIEAFSGAITVKDDSMLGYLTRGPTDRRRGEFAAATPDLPRAAGLHPAATRPLQEPRAALPP